MTKRKKYRFRCPVCGFLAWENRLNNLYPLEVIDVFSNGRGLIKNVYLGWGKGRALCSVFKSHFYDVLGYLLRHDYIDAGTVKKLADVYLNAEDVFLPEPVFNAYHIYEADVIFNPKVVD